VSFVAERFESSPSLKQLCISTGFRFTEVPMVCALLHFLRHISGHSRLVFHKNETRLLFPSAHLLGETSGPLTCASSWWRFVLPSTMDLARQSALIASAKRETHRSVVLQPRSCVGVECGQAAPFKSAWERNLLVDSVMGTHASTDPLRLSPMKEKRSRLLT
jgi:hypothetical protein